MSKVIEFGRMKNEWFLLPALGIKKVYRYREDKDVWEYRIAFAWMCFGISILVWSIVDEEC